MNVSCLKSKNNSGDITQYIFFMSTNAMKPYLQVLSVYTKHDIIYCL